MAYATGVTMVSGQKATTDLSTNRIKLSMAPTIAVLQDGESPMTAVMDKMGTSIAIGSRKRSWLTDVLRPEQAMLAATAAGTTTTITVEADEGTYFKAGEVWRVFDTGETILISSVATDTLTVVRNFGGATAGDPGGVDTIASAAYLERVSNNAMEGTTAPTAMSTTEVQYDNYTQINRTVLHLSNDDVAVLVYGEQDLPYEVKKKGKEHARENERSIKFGGKPVAETATTPAQSGGLWYWLRNYGSAGRVVYDATVTEAAFNTWVRHCFRYGPKKKVAFLCPVMNEALSQWASTKVRLQPAGEVNGCAVTRLVTPHGELMIIEDPTLEGPVEGGGSYGHNFILDMSDVVKCYVRGRDTALLTGRQANDEDANKQEYLTEMCLQLQKPQNHGYMYGTTAYTAAS